MIYAMISISHDESTGKVLYRTDVSHYPNHPNHPNQTTNDYDRALKLVPKIAKPTNKSRRNFISFSEWYHVYGTSVYEATNMVIDGVNDLILPGHIVVVNNNESFAHEMAMHMYNTFDATCC